jgi:hypothetical protein
VKLLRAARRSVHVVDGRVQCRVELRQYAAEGLDLLLEALDVDRGEDHFPVDFGNWRDASFGPT